jgi:hypothetical protein
MEDFSKWNVYLDYMVTAITNRLKPVSYGEFESRVHDLTLQENILWRDHGITLIHGSDVKAPIYKVPILIGDSYYNRNFCMWHHRPHIVFGAEGTIEYEIKDATCPSCGQVVEGHKSTW